MFGVGLGTSTWSVWLSPASSPELVAVTTTLTMMAINKACDVPASQADLAIPKNVPLPGVGPVPSGPGSEANSSTQPKSPYCRLPFGPRCVGPLRHGSAVGSSPGRRVRGSGQGDGAASTCGRQPGSLESQQSTLPEASRIGSLQASRPILAAFCCVRFIITGPFGDWISPNCAGRYQHTSRSPGGRQPSPKPPYSDPGPANTCPLGAPRIYLLPI